MNLFWGYFIFEVCFKFQSCITNPFHLSKQPHLLWHRPVIWEGPLRTVILIQPQLEGLEDRGWGLPKPLSFTWGVVGIRKIRTAIFLGHLSLLTWSCAAPGYLDFLNVSLVLPRRDTEGCRGKLHGVLWPGLGSHEASLLHHLSG